MADGAPSEESVFELGTDGPSVIVVGFDGSPAALRAGAYAAGLARRAGARLVVVHVVTAPVLALLATERPWTIEEIVDGRTAELREQVAAGAANAGIDAEFVAVPGEPFAALARVATDLRADLVVVGASARHGHRLAGSLGSRLIRAARWPVVVVP